MILVFGGFFGLFFAATGLWMLVSPAKGMDLATRIGVGLGGIVAGALAIAWARWVRRRSRGYIALHENAFVLEHADGHEELPWSEVSTAMLLGPVLTIGFTSRKPYMIMVTNEGGAACERIAEIVVARATGKPSSR